MNENAVIRKIKQISENIEHKFGFIAKYIIENAGDVSNMTIKELATKTYSSPATINRFVNSIDLDGYKEFVYVLRYYKRNYINQSETRNNLQLERYLPEQIITTYYQSIVKTLEDTKKILISQTGIIKQIVDKIHNSKKINIFGFGGTFNIASDFSDKLQRLGLNVTKNNDYHNGHYIVKSSKPEDLAIFISYSGETKELISLAKICHEKSTPILSVTKQNNNTISNLATFKLEITSDEPIRRSYSTTSRLALLVALDVVFLSLINSDQEKYFKLLKDTVLEKI